jgi:hypothetical protein
MTPETATFLDEILELLDTEQGLAHRPLLQKLGSNRA